MEPITFDDTLLHYRLKLLEALDYANNASAGIDDALAVVEDGWQGKAGQACRIRLEEMKLETDKTQLSIEHAISLVNEVIAQQQSVV